MSLSEVIRNPERTRHSTVIATDIEGPHLLDDTALNVMTRFVRPSRGNPEIDYGGTLFGQTYDWFEETFDTKGMGQEGSDIILTMPSLMYMGVTEKEIRGYGEASRRSPGSPEYVKYLRDEGAIAIGVSTAWDCAISDVVKQKVGLDGIACTDFPIDSVRENLVESGHFDQEMERTGNFLTDCFGLIEQMANSDNLDDPLPQSNLRKRIGQYFTEELGLSWSEQGNAVVRPGQYRRLAQLLAACDVIGDKRKAEVALTQFQEKGKVDAVNIAIGDGLNDRHMLARSAWGIGMNGADAAKHAKIGLITPDVSALIVVTDVIHKYPEPTPQNLLRVIHESQAALQDCAYVHLGGQDTPPELLQLHKEMKKKIRGNILV